MKRAPAGSGAFGRGAAGGDNSDGSESYSSDDSDVDIAKEDGDTTTAARVLDNIDELQVRHLPGSS